LGSNAIFFSGVQAEMLTLAAGRAQMLTCTGVLPPPMSFFRRHAPAPATIFVVDDEVLLLDLAETILAPLGCKVRTFSDPEQALVEYKKAAPAVVITDYAMGRMSGMDLIRECRRLNPQQKTILVSGTVDGVVFADASVKPDQFVAKPYDIKSFVETVRAMLAA
jgi:DNA-binding NtrC family response regulator